MLTKSRFQYHVRNCADRASLEQFKISEEMEDSEINVITYNELPSTENWDATSISSYNPKSYIETATLIRQAPAGSKPSERRNFRAAEFRRITSQQLDEK